jgi:iron(III) transport system substrate-binding protein
MTIPFEAKYGIRVEFTGSPGPTFPPQVQAERNAGQYLWDIYVGGTTTGLNALIPMGALDPLEPALILPEVKDPSNWRGGFEWLEEGKRMLTMTPSKSGQLFVNPNITDPNRFTSYRDLLAPEWKGKLIAHDPTIGGPGGATFTFFYIHPQLGPNFIRELAAQDLTIFRDFRQGVDAIARGRALVSVGGVDQIEPFIHQGLPITIVDPRKLREGTRYEGGIGNVGIFNRPSHPNAARVYVNWLLSQEGQTHFTGATGYISARLDVRTDHTFDWRVAAPGETLIGTATKEGIAKRDEALPLLRELFPS